MNWLFGLFFILVTLLFIGCTDQLTGPELIGQYDSSAESQNGPSQGLSKRPGGLIELSLRYDGPGGNLVVVADGRQTHNYNVGAVATGEEFRLNGTESDGTFASNELEFFVDGELVAVLHVSGSDEIGPGTTEQDGTKHKDPNGTVDFTVLEAISK